MQEYGALDDNNEIISEDLLKELAGVTQNFLESYFLTLNAVYSFRARDISPKELPKKIQDYGKARLAVSEVIRPESLSIINIKNAIRAFREDSVIQVNMDGSGFRFNKEVHAHYRDSLDKLIIKKL